MMVDETSLISILTKCIKDNTQEIQELKSKVDYLENELDITYDLKSENDELKKKVDLLELQMKTILFVNAINKCTGLFLKFSIYLNNFWIYFQKLRDLFLKNFGYIFKNFEVYF